MNGIDISSWQKGIELRALDIRFAILKLSEGMTWADPCFDGFYSAAQAIGLPVGAYVFSRATSADRAKAEAEKALALLRGRALPLGLYMDAEDDRMLALPAAALTDVVKVFCDTVRAAGYRAGAYGSAGRLWAKVEPSRLGEDVLVWKAAWSSREPKAPCDIWQYSDRERLAGYGGNLDGDRALSGRFLALLDGSEPPQPKAEAEAQPDTPTTPYWPPRVLCLGMQGADVAVLQALLRAHGYRAEISGAFDSKTKAAVLSFQSDSGLAADGIPGPLTFQALGVRA